MMTEEGETELRQRSDEPRQTESGGLVETVDYGSAEAYAAAVRAWLFAYRSWQAAQSMAPLLLQQAMLQPAHPAVTTTTQSRFAPRSSLLGRHLRPPPPPAGGEQYRVATYGRRLMAEMIDFCFCFALKLMVVYFLVELDFIDFDKYERLMTDRADLQTLVDVTQDLFPVELASKLVTSLLEAVYMSYGLGAVPAGYTPGKLLLGIRVVAVTHVAAVSPRDYRVLLHGVSTVRFSASLMRSLLKNFSLSFLFPLCVLMYAFRYNRSLYDVASGTIVVET